MVKVHEIILVEACDASEPGALSGNAAHCSCGEILKTSLSADHASSLGEQHATYYNRKESREY